MTIITKPHRNNLKEDEEQKIADAELDHDTKESVGGFDGSTTTETSFLPTFHAYLLHRKGRQPSSLCIGVLILSLVLGSLLVGILFFRHLTRKPTVGFCGTDLMLDTQRGGYPNSGVRLQQKATADPYHNFEKIEVPQFGYNRPAVFVHDFKQNLTAIVDVAGHKCFIKPLDKNILPPRNFSDLMKKMITGYYEQNTKILSEQWIARNPPMKRSEITSLHSYLIQAHCGPFQTYKLSRAAVQIQDHLLQSLIDPIIKGSRKLRRRRRSAMMMDGCISMTPSWNYVEFSPKHAVTLTEVRVC